MRTLPHAAVAAAHQRAFAAVETIQTKGCLTATQNQDADNLELDSVMGPSKPNTSITTSQVGSPTAATPALLTANLDSESELNEVPPTVIARKKRKRVQRDSGTQVFIAHMYILWWLYFPGSSNVEKDENGMYKDVDVLEIDSNVPSGSEKQKKKNPTADIDHFFKASVRIKGDKRGRRLCVSCAYVVDMNHST